MKQFLTLTALLLLITGLQAQTKTELQAMVNSLTAKNDSLLKLRTADLNLFDSLHHITGVDVRDLNNVKGTLAERKGLRDACADSLVKTVAHAGKLQHAVDSLLERTIVLGAEVDSLKALHTAHSAAAAHPAAGSTVSNSAGTAELLKLNGMLEQGLITKDEFLKMKKDVLK